MTQQTGSAVEAVRGAAPIYAGVGARKTPKLVLGQMREMAANLAAGGWQLRTGGAKGADDAFARGVSTDRRTVFIPWRGYNGWSGPEGRALTADELQVLRAAAAPHHPAWQNCAPRVRDLHARNVAVLLGADMREPVNAMVCWTESGRIQGGTGMAIRLAQHYRIPVLNLATVDVSEAMDRLDRIAETRHRCDVEQERALEGGTPDRRPSATSRPAPDKSDKDWWHADGEREVQEDQSRSVTRQRSMHL